MLRAYVLPFATTAVLALVLTPAVRVLARALGVVGRGGTRHLHRGAVPRLGGVAVFLAVAGGVVLTPLLGIDLLGLLQTYGWNAPRFAAGALCVLLLGIADDVREVRPLTKIAVQTVAALIAVQGGYGFSAVTNPFTGGYINLGALGGAISVLWVVGITNAFNLIDGLDGLAAGTGLIAALTLFLVALTQARPDAALLAALLGGALIGFLCFNFNPASIFLGDSGSLLLGYLLSVLSIQSLSKGATAVVVLVPVLALGLPILETGVTVVRRGAGAGMAAVVQADQEHIHHRLLGLGMTHRRAVLLLYGVCTALGLLAFLAITVRGIGTAAIVATVALATYAGIRRLGYRRPPASVEAAAPSAPQSTSRDPAIGGDGAPPAGSPRGERSAR